MKNIALFILCSFLFIINVRAEAGLLSSMEIASSGMKVQSKRLSIIAQNIANEDSTGITPGSAPYRRKIIFFTNQKDSKTGEDIVVIKKIGTDQSPFRVKFDPKHPAADVRGYVLYPNVDNIIENNDAMETRRSFDANINNIKITKNMIDETLNILR